MFSLFLPYPTRFKKGSEREHYNRKPGLPTCVTDDLCDLGQLHLPATTSFYSDKGDIKLYQDSTGSKTSFKKKKSEAHSGTDGKNH